MHRQKLSIASLPAWVKMNHIKLNGILVQDIPHKGSGLVVTSPTQESSLLVSVPKDLVLSIENIWIFAKADKQLREVLEAMGDYARVMRPALCCCHMCLSLMPILADGC